MAEADPLAAMLHEWGAQLLRRARNVIATAPSLEDLRENPANITGVELEQIKLAIERNVGVAGLVKVEVSDDKLVIGLDVEKLNRLGFIDAFVRFLAAEQKPGSEPQEPDTVKLSTPETPDDANPT